MKILIEYNEDGWKVTCGEKYADRLCHEEMIGILIHLTFPNDQRYINWMMTEEEHEARKSKFKS